MKKLLRFLLLFLFSGLLLGLAGLLGLTFYYRNNFPVNTWINGVYCTGKSIEQVNAELVEEALVNEREASVITIVDAHGTTWEINMLAAAIRPDYTDALKSYLRQNASIFWMDNLKKPVSSSLRPGKYIGDDEKLLACFQELSFVAEERKRPVGVKVSTSAEGFVLQDGNTGRLDLEKAFAYVEDCLSKGQTTVDLSVGECYEDLTDSASDKRQREIWEQVSRFLQQGCKIRYDMGTEEIAMTPAVLSEFLKTEGNGSPVSDEKGHIVVDEEKVQLWVDALAADYDTCGTEKQFAATRGDTVAVKYVTYGKIGRAHV